MSNKGLCEKSLAWVLGLALPREGEEGLWNLSSEGRYSGIPDLLHHHRLSSLALLPGRGVNVAAWLRQSWRALRSHPPGRVGQSPGWRLQAVALGCATRFLHEHQPEASYAKCGPKAGRTRAHTPAFTQACKHAHTNMHVCSRTQTRSCPLSTRTLGSGPVLTSSLLLQIELNPTARLLRPGRIIFSLSKGLPASKRPGLPKPGTPKLVMPGGHTGGRSQASKSGFRPGGTRAGGRPGRHPARHQRGPWCKQAPRPTPSNRFVSRLVFLFC